jgi:RNA polymerase sigma-70 factor (ECF subfamily)
MRAGRGDVEAFGQLHAALRLAVRDFVASRHGFFGSDEIDEIAQEVFLRAWKNAPNFRRNASAKTYLFGIARNVLREALRRRAKGPLPFLRNLDDIEGRPHDFPVDDNVPLIAQAIERAKAELTAEQRKAFELVCIQGLTIADAAKRCDCSPNQFRNRLWRAKTKLRESLRRWSKATPP